MHPNKAYAQAHEIASDHDKLDPLSSSEIDDLCERLNCGETCEDRGYKCCEHAGPLLDALEKTRAPLVLLGNYIGNKWKGGGGIEAFDRCAIIEQVANAIDAEKNAHA